MATITCEYMGNLRVKCVHEGSGATIITDAPLDNHGRGEGFSPTDLCVTSLAACAMTIIGITAQAHSIDVSGMRIDALKIMSTKPPRKIGRIEMVFHMPKIDYTSKEKELIERAARHCPVHLSLDPDIDQLFTFEWS